MVKASAAEREPETGRRELLYHIHDKQHARVRTTIHYCADNPCMPVTKKQKTFCCSTSQGGRTPGKEASHAASPPPPLVYASPPKSMWSAPSANERGGDSSIGGDAVSARSTDPVPTEELSDGVLSSD